MENVNLPGFSKPISPLVLGTMIVDLQNLDMSMALLDAALELGINALDTAHVYAGGNSERAIGRWMEERGNRERVFILTKGAHPNGDRARVTPYDIEADLMDSLARLRTHYIDLYLLHRDDETQPVGPIVEALGAQQIAGAIRAYGVSNWKHDRIAEANAYAKEHGLPPIAASSPNFGLCEQVNDPWGPGCVTISGPGEAEAREFYRQSDMPVFAYSSLGRGMLSGRVNRENYAELLDGAALKAYAHEVNFKRLDRAVELSRQKGATVPQIGVAYIVSAPFKAFPIVGAASQGELCEIANAAQFKLSPEECAWLDNG